jgi:hypothetical protein
MTYSKPAASSPVARGRRALAILVLAAAPAASCSSRNDNGASGVADGSATIAPGTGGAAAGSDGRGHHDGSAPEDSGGGNDSGTPAFDCAKVFGTGAASQWVSVDASGHLAYKTLPKGDRIIDFSSAGYGGGGVTLPTATVQKSLKPSGGDDSAAIQAAIDAVSKMPLGADGLRGAVLLAPGTFNLQASTLTIAASGVVLRGSGSGSGGTVVNVTGTPRLFMSIAGTGRPQTTGTAATVTDSYVAAGTTTFTVDNAAGFAVGDTVLVDRPVTSGWITFMGMDQLTRNGAPQTWLKPGTIIRADRVISAISGNAITVDTPISDALDGQFVSPPGVTVTKYSFAGRIAQVGLEHLSVVAPAVSTPISGPIFTFLSMDAVIDGWARDVVFQDFTNGVEIGGGAKRLTLEDMAAMHTVPGTVPQPADFSADGQQILVQRASTNATTNVHFLVTQATTPGPIVFLKFSAPGGAGDDIAPHQRWATGVLFDQVSTPGSGIELNDRGNFGSGQGWAAGFSVLWNSTAKSILVQQPPGAQNWSIGCTGVERTSAPPGGTQVLPQGAVDSPGVAVAPVSLYLAQLCERLGPAAVAAIGDQ